MILFLILCSAWYIGWSSVDVLSVDTYLMKLFLIIVALSEAAAGVDDGNAEVCLLGLRHQIRRTELPAVQSAGKPRMSFATLASISG